MAGRLSGSSIRNDHRSRRPPRPSPTSFAPAWVCLIGALAGFGLITGATAAPGRDYRLGDGRWSLEQFGRDVAVLRSGGSSPMLGAASLLLSCSENERRFRLELPEVSPRSGILHSGTGVAMIAPATQRRNVVGMVVRFRSAGAALLVSGTGSPDDDPVTRLGIILAGRPPAIDVVLSWGPGPVTLTRLEVVRLVLGDGSPDREVIDHLLRVCRAAARRSD